MSTNALEKLAEEVVALGMHNPKLRCELIQMIGDVECAGASVPAQK